MNVEKKLATLGLELPSLEDLYSTNSSGAHYISHFPVQNLLYLSGTTPRKGGQPYLPGVVGKDLTLEQGYTAARNVGLAVLADLKRELGDLDRISAWLRVFGMVNSAPGFTAQPQVIDGFTDLMIALYGEDIAICPRAVMGAAELGFDSPVIIEGEVEIRA